MKFKTRYFGSVGVSALDKSFQKYNFKKKYVISIDNFPLRNACREMAIQDEKSIAVSPDNNLRSAKNSSTITAHIHYDALDRQIRQGKCLF